jgi:lipopolysaccharide transport system permease protein
VKNPSMSRRGLGPAMAEDLAMLARHRWLVWELAKREHADRYAGSLFGSMWAIGHPLLLMAVYVVVFSYVFRLKLGGTTEMPLDYTVYLMAGYLPWMALQESALKAASAITAHAGLVKEAAFPLEILPVKTSLSVLGTQAVGTAFLVGYIAFVYQTVPWTYLLIPGLLGLQVLTMLGTALGLAAVGVFFRDTRELVQVGALVGMYLVPVFYIPDWTPAALRPLIYLNPLSSMIWCYQDVFYFGRLDHPGAWLVFTAVAVVTWRAGASLFGRLKDHFGAAL